VFTFLKEAQPYKSFSRAAAEYPGFPDVVETVALADFIPAHYEVRVSVRSGGQEIASSKDEFDVTPLVIIARPWIYSKIMPGLSDAVYPFLIGNQLFNAGRYEEARLRLEEAVKKKPEEADYALALARADMTLKDYSRVETLLLPFFGQAKPPRYEMFVLMASAHYRKGE